MTTDINKIDDILNMERRLPNDNAINYEPLRGMNKDLARNIIVFLGGADAFIDIAQSNDSITGVLSTLADKEFDAAMMREFYENNQLQLIDFFSNRNNVLNSHNGKVSSYIADKYNALRSAGRSKGKEVSPKATDDDATNALYNLDFIGNDCHKSLISLLCCDAIIYLARSYIYGTQAVPRAYLVSTFFSELRLDKEGKSLIGGELSTLILNKFGGIDGFIDALDDKKDGFTFFVTTNHMDNIKFYDENRDRIMDFFERLAVSHNNSGSIVLSAYNNICTQNMSLDKVATGIYENTTSKNPLGSTTRCEFIDVFMVYLLNLTCDIFEKHTCKRAKKVEKLMR